MAGKPQRSLASVSDYPTIWFSLFRLIAKWGDPVFIFGMAQLVALLGVGLWLSRQKEGYLAVLLVLSPPILLGIERGNSDIAIFLLMIAGVWRAALFGGVFFGSCGCPEVLSYGWDRLRRRT